MGDADDFIAGPTKCEIATAVALECAAIGVVNETIEFDDQSGILPETVDLKAGQRNVYGR